MSERGADELDVGGISRSKRAKLRRPGEREKKEGEEGERVREGKRRKKTTIRNGKAPKLNYEGL